MRDKTVAEKARVKPGTSIAILEPVDDVVESLGLAPDTPFVEPAEAQLVFLFVRARSDIERLLPSAVQELAPEAAIWVFFRKGSRSAGLDMSRNDVWAVAERLGLRPLGLVSVDAEWSAFRLRR